MTLSILRSTSAIVMVAALLQPVPLLAQSGVVVETDRAAAPLVPDPDAEDMTSEEICAQARITDPEACAEHILELEAAAELAAENEAGLAEAAEAEAEAVLEAEAAAEADAAAEAEAASEAEMAAEAEAAALEAEAAAEADAAAEAEAVAEAEMAAAAEEAAREAEAAAEADTAAEAEAAAEAEMAADDTGRTPCVAQIVGGDGAMICVETLTPDTVAALAADTAVDSEAEVTQETITEDSVRASAQDFEDWRGAAPAATESDSGPSDLERAGLLLLGAVVVGAILANGQRVEANTGDRIIVVDEDGTYDVLRDDDALLRQPGAEVRTERFADGSTRTIVTRADGTRIITIRDSSGRALRRLRIDPDGREYLLIDDTRVSAPVVLEDLPLPVKAGYDDRSTADSADLRLALLAADRGDLGRSFSLRQVRDIRQVRALAPEITLSGITFETDSAAIARSQAGFLREMGQVMRALIAIDPTEVFLIEGYTDAVGAAGYNLLLSDRRAESVALAFSEYFDVPAENMVVQGYGESDLLVATQGPERENRRVAVRRITPLLRGY